MPWCFCLPSRKLDASTLTSEEVDKRITTRSLEGLKLYDGIRHEGMFNLPLFLRNALAGQRRIITDEDPLYLYTG